jgi:peptidoglycan/LPS O-acetylase OafA/YrhL
MAWFVRAREGLLREACVLFFASCAASIVLLSTYPTSTFYVPFTRTWEILGCAILALVPHVYDLDRIDIFPNISKLRLSAWKFLSPDGPYGRSVLPYDAADRADGLPGRYALSGMARVAHVVGANRGSGNRALISIGLLSYPVFLWYWPILCFLRLYWTLPPPFSLLLAAGLLSIVLAAATYRFVEKPIRFRGAAAGENLRPRRRHGGARLPRHHEKPGSSRVAHLTIDKKTSGGSTDDTRNQAKIDRISTRLALNRTGDRSSLSGEIRLRPSLPRSR